MSFAAWFGWRSWSSTRPTDHPRSRSRDLFNIGLKPEDRHKASVEQRLPELYHSDRVYVIVSFDTALGAHIVQTYLWFANAHPQNQDHIWEMLSLVIADGGDDPEPFKMEWQ